MLELASLKFSVDTTQLKDAADKLDALVQKAGNLGKVTKELATSEKNLAVASKESAKAADLNASAALKLAKAREADAKANERNAKASKTVAEANVKQTESSQRIAAAQERQSRATKTVTDDADRLIKLYTDLVSKANFVEQGFTRTEASLLTLATNLGATTGDVKDFAEAFDRIRKVIGGDPFDKSGSSLKRLQQELDISKKLTQSFGEAGALTKKQIADLGRDLERTAALGKQFNLSQQEIEKEQNRIQKEFLETAKALNDQNAALKRLERGSKDSADAHVTAFEREKKARAQAVEGFTKYIQKVELTKAATKELYSQGVFSRTTINQFVELERKAKEAGISLERLNEIKANFARADAGNAGLKFQADLISGLTRQIITLGAAYASIQGLGQAAGFFITTADQMKLLKSRLDIAGEGTINFKKNFGDLVKIANDTRSPIEAVTTVFTRLVPIMPAMGKGVKEATQVTEALTKMLRISGRGAQEASSAMLQFSQAMAKGKLDGDEFRSLAENLPEVLRVLEKQLGKTRAEIMLMSSAGMLTSTIMTEAMIASLSKLDAQLAKMPETVEGATTVLKNNFTLLVQKMDEATGISDKLAGAVLKVAEGIKSAADAGPAMTGLLTGITTFAGASIIAGLGALAAKLVAVAAGYGSIRLAVMAFSGFLATNPIGLAILGFSAIAGIKSMNDAQKTQVNSVQEANEKLKKAGIDRQEITKKLLVDQLALSKLPEPKTQLDRNTRSIYEDRVNLRKKELQEVLNIENALNQNKKQFQTGQTQTAEEKFKAGLNPAERQASGLSGLEAQFKDLGGLKEADSLKAKYREQIDKAGAELSRASKDADFRFQQAKEEILALNLGTDQKNARLTAAAEASVKMKEQAAKLTIGNLALAKKNLEESLAKIDRKEQGPVKQASTEGYNLVNDGQVEALNKIYADQIKTIRAGETAKRQLLDMSGLEGAARFEENYRITNESNQEEYDAAVKHYEEIKKVTEKHISDRKALYSKFVKEQSGKEGFGEANQKQLQDTQNDVAKLNRELTVAKALLDGMQKRQTIEVFSNLTKDVGSAASNLRKMNDTVSDLIAKENTLAIQRQETEQFQIDSIGLTERQIVALKAETDERNRLVQARGNVVEKSRLEIESLNAMIRKKNELIVAGKYGTQEEQNLTEAITIATAERDKLNEALATYNYLLETAPQKEAERALREMNRKEIQDFSNKVSDALNTGIFSGAKAGSRKLRQVIVDELKKPITITVQALVSTAMNALTGGGSTGVLGGISNLLGMGKTIAGAADYLGLSSLFSAGVGTTMGALGTGLTASSVGAATGYGLTAGTGTVLGASGSGLVAGGGLLGSSIGAGAGTTLGAAGSGLTAGTGASLGASGAASGLASIGSALAAAAPYLAIATVLFKGFSMGPRQVTGTGVTGTFGQSGFEGNLFENWKKKGGWFRSDKSGTDLKTLDSGIDKSLDEAFTNLKLSAIESAKAMGLTTDSIVNFTKTVKIDFSNNADENNKKMQEMLEGMSDDIARILIPSIDSMSVAGEKAKDTFARLATNLTTVNSVVGLLGVKLIDVSVVGAQAATALSDMFGGLDKLKEATTVYYDAFYSQDEKMTLSLKVMTDAMKSVGLTLPATKDEFRKMVDVLDLNTEYGRNLYSVMVKIAPTFNEFTTAIDEVKTKVTEAASTLRDSIFEARYGTMTSEVQLSTLQEQFNTLVAQAALQSGSELSVTSEKISSSLQPLLEKVKEVYASGPEYFRLQEEILSKAGMIANRSDNLGTYEDRSLKSFDTMTSILSKINESGQLTVSNLEKLINYGNTTNPVTSGTTTGYAQATIVKANSEAAGILEKIAAQSKVTSAQNAIVSSTSHLKSLQDSLTSIKTNAVMSTMYGEFYTADPNENLGLDKSGNPRVNKFAGNLDAVYDYISKYIIYSDPAKPVSDSIVSLQNNITELNKQIQYQQSIAGDISSQDTETKLATLRKQITDAGGVPAFAKGGAFTNGIVKEPTLFNMGLMGESTPEGILPLARTSSGALGVQSVGVGSQEVSERLVESNRHLGALVRLQQASNLKIIEKLSEVEQRLEGIETSSRLEAMA